MSKLNDLITKLCPDGVPYKPMWAITTWDKKFNGVDKKKQPAINKHHYYLAKELEPLIVPNGDIKVLTTSPSDLYTTTELAKDNIKDGEIIAIPWGGNAIVQYYNGKYITSDNRIAIVNDTKQLKCKFLYYVLKNREKELAKYYRGAGIKHPNMFKVLHMEIPVPPLPVQEEVVRILDSFTELEAELEAELADRKEQYEYYRDYLLDKNTLERMDGKPVEMKKLGEVEEDGLIKLGRGNVISKRDIANNPGTYPIYSASVTNNGKFGEYGNYMFDDTRLTWSIDGGGRFFYRDDEKYSVTNVCGWLKVLDENAFNPKFLFYVLTSQWSKLVFNYTVKAHPSVIRNIYNIPMVSLSTQERIVDILDRFDALTTSLTDGIPAEIAMRREQYEYYRSRLLDFPHLPDGSASVSDSE